MFPPLLPDWLNRKLIHFVPLASGLAKATDCRPLVELKELFATGSAA